MKKFFIISFLSMILLLQPLKAADSTGIMNINGHGTYFRITGSGDNLVVVHGGPGLGHDYLIPHFKTLSDSFRLLFYDQLGCGLSDSVKLKDSLTMSLLVDQLEGVRKSAGIEKMNLAGQSFGALIAINYTLKYPRSVKTLLLLEPAPGSTEYLSAVSRRIARRLSDSERQRLKEIFLSQEMKDNSPGAFREFMNTRFKAYYKDTLLLSKEALAYFDRERVGKFFRSSRALEPYFMSFNLYDKIADMKCPVLIIHGDYDPVPDEAIERYHIGIKDSEMHIISNCGHFVHIERPGDYFTLIRNFLWKHKDSEK